jgi:methylated-DNA-[protein]-cysteine S-methyltransferase
MVTLMKIEDLIGSIDSEFGDEVVEELLRQVHEGLDRALKRIRRPRVAVGVVDSPLGDLLVATGDRGIVLNHYLGDESDLRATIARLRFEFDPVEDGRAVRQIGEEIRHYLAGDENALRQNVDLSLVGSPFQKKVLSRLRAVPRGAVISYQALGASLGAPKGARAVGNALHNNPVPIYVPCHRVISSDRRIGGYAGGTARKLLLLRSEGFAIDTAEARIPDSVVSGHKGTRIYCRTNCRTAAHVGRTRILFFADPKDAQRAGMRACKICQPA